MNYIQKHQDTWTFAGIGKSTGEATATPLNNPTSYIFTALNQVVGHIWNALHRETRGAFVALKHILMFDSLREVSKQMAERWQTNHLSFTKALQHGQTILVTIDILTANDTFALIEDKDEDEVQWSEERFCGDRCGFCDKPIYRKQEN